MTLQEFIEQEIYLCHIGCFDDFRESLQELTNCDGEELDTNNFDSYLDCNVEWAQIKINYGHFDGVVWYEVELSSEE